jgi:peptide/nickel transport system permease protein
MNTVAAAAQVTPPRRRWLQAAACGFRNLHWTPSFALAAVMLTIVLALVFVTPLLPGYDVYSQDLGAMMESPFAVVDGNFYLLGTDPLGRDMLSRLSLAGQVSLFIGVTAVAVSLVVGVTLGLVAGFFGGRIESVIMGFADLQLSIPRVLLLIGVAALIGSSVFNLTMLLALTSWVTYGRIARALALSLKEREFVLAAKVQGASPAWNIRKHLLPNVMQPMLIVAAFELGQIIVLEASLSYLGVGVRPPLPSWGMMIKEGQDNLQLDPWLAILPGLAIFMLVAGIQFVSQHFSPDGERAVRLQTKRG